MNPGGRKNVPAARLCIRMGLDKSRKAGLQQFYMIVS
jgi:hypothetical protein